MDPKQELNKMKKSLSEWLHWRNKLKQKAPQRLEKDTPSEIKLAKKLEELLSKIEPDEDFSGADAEELAQIVLKDSVRSPQAQGILPWVVVGGTLVILYSIKSFAESAKQERMLQACKEGIEGACPGPWKKLFFFGAVGIGLYWFLGTSTGKDAKRKLLG